MKGKLLMLKSYTINFRFVLSIAYKTKIAIMDNEMKTPTRKIIRYENIGK